MNPLRPPLFPRFPSLFAVEKRCEDIQMNTKVFIESLKATFAAHMMKFPKATRALTTDEFFGEEVQQFDDVKAKAGFILMSACKPGRAPLTQARPHVPVPIPASMPPSSTTVPGSVTKPGRPPRGFETPKPVGRVIGGITTPAHAVGAETPALLASVYVNKVCRRPVHVARPGLQR
jgi:hypothetical protein